jgi:maleamate amidohydrolase
MRHFEDYCWKDVAPADLLTIYSAYRRERGVPPRPALLILHPKLGAEITLQQDWQPAAARLVERARALSLPIQHSLPPDAAPARRVAPLADELIIRRPRESAFLFSDLAAVLTNRGIHGLIVCGASTSGAVRATAVEAKSYGYKAAIAEEATGDEAELLHKMALFDIAHKYADVMSLDEMLHLMDERGRER